MSLFKLQSIYQPTGDQPQAIKTLVKSLRAGHREQTLLGVTGSGKTFTMANVIAALDQPTLVISHNKTLAAQLYGEFRAFFPDNAVHYFVSYYDYYQPEAYIPQTDTYIEKEATVNEEIDRLRHAATQSLINRQDVLIVASVSCIYGLGEKKDYEEMGRRFALGETMKRNEILRQLVSIQYERNDTGTERGQFRVRGDSIDIRLATGEAVVRFSLAGDTLETITVTTIRPGHDLAWAADGKTGEKLEAITILPAKHFMTPAERMHNALATIRTELEERLNILKAEGKLVEAYRLERKTNYDLEMLEQVGYCNGIENYSRHLSGRAEGEPPSTLIDFFPPGNFLTIIDESHQTLPQLRAMYAGDRSRKDTLVEFGFRLPSARDNRPLRFEEFNQRVGQIVYASATPTEYEFTRSQAVAEQIIRPTGLLDPAVEVRPRANQINDLIAEIDKTVAAGQRVLVTTLTKKMAEELSAYLNERKMKVQYLHSDIETIERVEILRDLREGKYDVLVGINLLREGLDLPEVSLVAILDADVPGFLRSETSLMQTMGRAARHINGRVIMYADSRTPAMRFAIAETQKRRERQAEYNTEHGITPRSTKAPMPTNLLE